MSQPGVTFGLVVFRPGMSHPGATFGLVVVAQV